jgi:hypothetical protein
MSSPAIQIDHLRNGFNNGRWIFVNADLLPEFFSAGYEIIKSLTQRALQGAEEFTVRPIYPLYLPGERAAIALIGKKEKAVIAVSAGGRAF